MTKLLNYADIAKALNVSVETVWAYAGRDSDFPTRVNAETERSPLFLEEDVDEYRRQKRDRARGRAGHPPVSRTPLDAFLRAERPETASEGSWTPPMRQ